MKTTDVEAFLKPGRALGATAWEPLPQHLLTDFEVLTKSNDPLHTDIDWVREHTAYGTTIVPGFLVLSLLPHFIQQLDLTPEGFHAVNYGLDRVRWVDPIPVDSQVRAAFTAGGIVKRYPDDQGYVVKYDVRLEVRGSEAPGMIAEWLGAILPDSAS